VHVLAVIGGVDAVAAVQQPRRSGRGNEGEEENVLIEDIVAGLAIEAVEAGGPASSLPPSSLSLPAPPRSTSVPLPPNRKLAPALPMMVSSPCVPRTFSMLVSTAAPLIVPAARSIVDERVTKL